MLVVSLVIFRLWKILEMDSLNGCSREKKGREIVRLTGMFSRDRVTKALLGPRFGQRNVDSSTSNETVESTMRKGSYCGGVHKRIKGEGTERTERMSSNNVQFQRYNEGNFVDILKNRLVGEEDLLLSLSYEKLIHEG